MSLAHWASGSGVQGQEGGSGGRMGQGGGNTAPPCRVWLYVDDQLQQMKPHQGPPPRPQPQESQDLFLGGLSKTGDYFNFKGCISNVFVMR